MSEPYLLLVTYFPSLLLPFLVALKFSIRYKLNNTIFYSILILILVYMSVVLCTVAILVVPVLVQGVGYSLLQKVNTFFSFLSVIYFSFYPIFFIVFYSILAIIIGIVVFKTKEYSFLKNFLFSSIFLILLLVFSIPTIISPPLKLNDNIGIIDDIEYIKRAKIATDISFLPPMKLYYADNVAISIDTYFSKKFILNQENPDFSSEEAQLLINDYLKYRKITVELSSYYNYTFLALFCKKIKRYNEALEYLSIAEKYGVKVEKLRNLILKEMETIKKES